jgi:hypothetical protein
LPAWNAGRRNRSRRRIRLGFVCWSGCGKRGVMNQPSGMESPLAVFLSFHSIAKQSKELQHPTLPFSRHRNSEGGSDITICS